MYSTSCTRSGDATRRSYHDLALHRQTNVRRKHAPKQMNGRIQTASLPDFVDLVGRLGTPPQVLWLSSSGATPVTAGVLGTLSFSLTGRFTEDVCVLNHGGV